MEFTIVTGMSGAGKTQALKYLEDCGFFCVDNLLPEFIIRLFDIFRQSESKFAKVALVTDMRVGDKIDELFKILDVLKKDGYDYKLLFLTASDESLVNRYKETRHQHPTQSSEGLLGSIRTERKKLEKLYLEADYVIDTSQMELYQLQRQLKRIFKKEANKIKIDIIAFGYKYGLPLESDFVFDVRCFPNPFYVPHLKNKTGEDSEVRDYVMSTQSAQKYFSCMYGLIVDNLPLYSDEGKEVLTVSVGCTGGKHRSVTFAKLLSDELVKQGYETRLILRDATRGK